jgi:ADP-heptose:LPS heptosyltransferase
LRRRFPDAEITLIGLPWARELVERLPTLDHLEVFPGYPGIKEVPFQAARTHAFLDAARATGYDLALQMHGAGQISNGFVADLGAPVSLGYRQGADDRLTLTLPYDPDEHEVLRWLRLVAALGAPADDTRLDCPVTPDDEARAAALLAETTPASSLVAPPDQPAPLIGLHPGARDCARRWPPERFAALADLLVERCGARVILTGSADERAVTATVRGAVRHPALDLAGRTDLGSLAALVARLDLLVTNDTGASHVAAATGTRSVILFGPNRPEVWAPLDRQRHRVVEASTLAGNGRDPATALRQLPVEPVFALCQELLDPRSSPVVR